MKHEEYVRVYQAILSAGDISTLRIDSLEQLTLETVFEIEEPLLFSEVSLQEIMNTIDSMRDALLDLGYQMTPDSHSINVHDDVLLDFYNRTVGMINGWSVSYEEHNRKTVLVYELMSGEKAIGTIEGIADELSRMDSNLRDIGYSFSMIQA